MNELIDEFIRFNKVLGLHIANLISTKLNVGLCIQEFSGGINDYQSVISHVPNCSFIGQFSYKNRGVFISIDPRIILMGTQRCFGGKPNVTHFEKTGFSFSETFVGKTMIDMFNVYFKERNCSIELNRIDFFVDRSHVFFADEQIVSIEKKCTVNGVSVGSIYLIYPLIFVKQEKKQWVLNTIL